MADRSRLLWRMARSMESLTLLIPTWVQIGPCSVAENSLEFPMILRRPDRITLETEESHTLLATDRDRSEIARTSHLCVDLGRAAPHSISRADLRGSQETPAV